MTPCPGELVVHRDRSLWCSEVRAGRRCLGIDQPHRAVWSCRLVWGPEPCPRCSCLPSAAGSVTSTGDSAPVSAPARGR